MFVCSRVSYCTILLHPPLPDCYPTPNTGDESASVAPRGGAFVLANMTNPHLAPPGEGGGGGGGQWGIILIGALVKPIFVLHLFIFVVVVVVVVVLLLLLLLPYPPAVIKQSSLQLR